MRGLINKDEIQERIDEHNTAEKELSDAVDNATKFLAFVELNDPGDTKAIAEAHEDVADAETALDEWQRGPESREREELNSVLDEVTDDGFPLIPEREFTSYAQEILEDMGEIPKNFPSYIVIDWEATADNLKQDYSTITLNGADYYYRNT